MLARIELMSNQKMTETIRKTAHVSLAEALSKGPPPPGNLAVPVFAHGSLEIELYTPKDHDPQQPHGRDEVYLVIRGSGVFFDGERRHSVTPGSFLFVAAGQPHRFEDFSEDFAVWVFFTARRVAKRLRRVDLASRAFWRFRSQWL
jgi:mannose-6-phosphate isomerase-like protein (cupin superfamily)